MNEWISGAEKSPNRTDALVHALSMLNLNVYCRSYFDTAVFDAPISQEVGFSIASSEGFEDI